MSRLVLKGHATRGKEVINLLEMLGANRLGYKDTFVGFYYYIECGAICSSDECPTYSTIFTLEEFEEKFPYKVGDTVACYIGLILGKEIHTITEMQWDSNKCRILYYLDDGNVLDVRDVLYSVEYKTEQSKQERVKDMDLKNYGTATIKYIQENGSRDMELIIPYNQEIVNIDGRYILRDKKLQCPKTYAECCEIVDYHLEGATIIGYKKPLLENLQQLLICRDAYWKMADDWKPDWADCKDKFCITIFKNKPIFDDSQYISRVLAFPAEEMRDAFYDNFKELIDKCKELL